jgi:hypothetical protein
MCQFCWRKVIRYHDRVLKFVDIRDVSHALPSNALYQLPAANNTTDTRPGAHATPISQQERKTDIHLHYKVFTNSMAFSPQANYTHPAFATCRRSYCQNLLFRILHGQSSGSVWSLISVFLTGAVTFHLNSISNILTSLTKLRSKPTISHKIW